jgi:hypothetical protein
MPSDRFDVRVSPNHVALILMEMVAYLSCMLKALLTSWLWCLTNCNAPAAKRQME